VRDDQARETALTGAAALVPRAQPPTATAKGVYDGKEELPEGRPDPGRLGALLVHRVRHQASLPEL
jgi:hypothetical protein